MISENNNHYSEQTGHRERGIFAKWKNMVENGFRRNPEWQQFAGREYRFPSQFGEALVIEEHNCSKEEVTQLLERGAIFPLETAQPDRTAFYKQDDAWKSPLQGLVEPLPHGLDQSNVEEM